MLGRTLEIHNPIDIGSKVTTINKLEETYKLAEEIIMNLDDGALYELQGGTEKDLGELFDNIVHEVYYILYGDEGYVKESNLQYLSKLASTTEETLRIENLNYFITSLLPSFEMNWHHVEWGELAAKYKKLCILAARDHGKSYFFSHAFPIWKMYKFKNQKLMTKPNKEISLCERGFIITNEQDLGKDLLEIVKGTIEENDVLRERLYPDGGKGFAETRIKTKNGARLQIKSYGGAFRGRHPHYVIGDDLLKDNVLYSEIQRKKATDWFHSVIMNAVVPGGQTVVVGTPFHEKDLYGDLKDAMKRTMTSKIKRVRAKWRNSWVVFEYPSIYPDGRILWESRYTFDDLMEKREEQGNIRFSREHLVRPIISDSSIFTYNILKNALVGMESYTLVKNRDSFPIKFNRVVVGCDFAMSASVDADFTVFMTFGVDDNEVMWLLNMWRGHGKSYLEQLAVMKTINTNFRPDVMYVEANQFQRIFYDAAKLDGLPVYPHTTHTNKFDLEKGLPSVELLFERQVIKFPRGDSHSRNMTDLILTELGAVTWTEKGKLEGVGEHDDCAMALWISSLAKTHVSTGFGIDLLEG